MTSESESENFPIPRSCDVCARRGRFSTYAVIYRVIYGEIPHLRMMSKGSWYLVAGALFMR